MTDLPTHWAVAMKMAGHVDPRRQDDVPSITQLAKAAGVAVETVRRLISGEGVPDPETVQKVSDALKLDPKMVSRWVGQDRLVRGPWSPPSDAALLSDEERDVLDRLIRVMAGHRRRIGEALSGTGFKEIEERLSGSAQIAADARPERGTRHKRRE